MKNKLLYLFLAKGTRLSFLCFFELLIVTIPGKHSFLFKNVKCFFLYCSCIHAGEVGVEPTKRPIYDAFHLLLSCASPTLLPLAGLPVFAVPGLHRITNRSVCFNLVWIWDNKLPLYFFYYYNFCIMVEYFLYN